VFLCSVLVLISPRLGILAIEILVGLILMGCAFVSRRRINRACAQLAGKNCVEADAGGRSPSFDRYDLLVMLTIIILQSGIAGALRRAGWSESSIYLLPLVLLVIGFLLKTRLLNLLRHTTRVRMPPIDGKK
jgi:hypothetical protein